MITNALTIDVEDYFHVENFKGFIQQKDWETYESRIEANTYTVLKILDLFQYKTTFFVLGWIADRYKELIKLIHQEGHEIASHGYSHELIYITQPEDFRQDLRKSKMILEDLTGDRVIGYRAPSYSITKKSLWAIDILLEEGFEYDSSIFPTMHDRYGIADAHRFPHKLKGGNGNYLTEFPPSTFRVIGMNIPVSGGGYFRFFPYYLTKKFFNSINQKERKPFIFYLHPWEFDPEQPKIKTNKSNAFRHYFNLNKTEKKFSKLLKDFKFDAVKNILASISFD